MARAIKADKTEFATGYHLDIAAGGLVLISVQLCAGIWHCPVDWLCKVRLSENDQKKLARHPCLLAN